MRSTIIGVAAASLFLAACGSDEKTVVVNPQPAQPSTTVVTPVPAQPPSNTVVVPQSGSTKICPNNQTVC